MSSIQSSDLSKISYEYNSNSNLIKTLTGNSADTTSTSTDFLNGISNVDTYVTNSLSTANTDSTTYTADVLKKNYNLSNLTNALNAMNNTESFESISNLNDYTTNLIKFSQSSAFDTTSQITSLLNSGLPSSNLNQNVINTYKSNSILSSLQSGTLDVKT
jgi:hypothetical protein